MTQMWHAVQGQTGQIGQAGQTVASIILGILQTIFNTNTNDIFVLVFCFVFFLLLAITFYRILLLFSPFSKFLVGIISIGLCVTFSLTGLIAKMMNFFVNNLGPIVTLFIILLFFFGSYMFDFLARRTRTWKEFKEKLEEEKGKEMLKSLAKKIEK